MTQRSLPLTTRPRRPVVRRPPTLAQESYALRRSAAQTTRSCRSRSCLPGPVVAQAGIPAVEAVAYLLLVVVALLPVVVISQADPRALLTSVFALTAAGAILWARRVVVGDDYVAVRSLLRYHVASTSHVRHLELRPTQRGGALCLHTDDGHCVRLRRAEIDGPAVLGALRALAGCSDSTRDRLTRCLLDLSAAPDVLDVRQAA